MTFQNRTNLTGVANSIFVNVNNLVENVPATVVGSALYVDNSYPSNLTFGNPPIVGRKILLSKQIASNSSALIFTNLTGYTYYVAEVTQFESTADQWYFGMLYSVDNGNTFNQSNYLNYGIQSVQSGVGGGAGFNGNNTVIDYSCGGVKLTYPGPGLSGTFYFFGLNNPNQHKYMMCDAVALISPFSNQYVQSSRGCTLLNAQAFNYQTVNCLKMFCSNGPISYAEVAMYGVV